MKKKNYARLNFDLKEDNIYFDLLQIGILF